MIFQRIFNEELNPQQVLLLSLLDHVVLSPRQFCILANWKISKLRVVVHRIRQGASKEDQEKWVRCDPTRFQRDRFYYSLGSEGLRYCGRLLNKRFPITSKVDESIAQNAHYLGLNEILVRMVEAGMDRQKIIWLATNAASDYLYRIYKMREPQVDQKELIRPDARLVYGNKAWWIEYDNATEGPMELETKLINYVEILGSLHQSWVDPNGKERRPLDSSSVIWVAKSAQRKKYIESIWKGLMSVYFAGQWVPEMHFFAPTEDTKFFMEQCK